MSNLTYHMASAPLFTRGLKAMSNLLDKAVAGGMSEADIMEARLAPDMLPLPAQIGIASDTAKGAIARLAGVENPVMADDAATVADLKERLAKTVAFIDSVAASKFEGAADREIVLKFPQIEMHFRGHEYLPQFALPNFYFHVTMLYAILRMKGVALGKGDFLSTMDPSFIRPKG